MLHRQPLVSVVIPAHNAEAFLGEAIASVLSQTYPRFEIIVVDDGSTDGTTHVASSFGGRLKLLQGPNRGVSHARNKGLAVAHGELIAFLDADDRWLTKRLEVQVAQMIANPDLLAIGSLMQYESLDGRSLGETGQAVGPAELERVARGHLMPFPLSSILFRTEPLQRLGGFDESLPKNVQVEDLDLVARLANLGLIACQEEVLGAYRIHPRSASARRFAQQRMGTRFVRARLAARRDGRELTWHDFAGSYRMSWRQRHGDFVQACYRRAGESLAGRRWVSVLLYGSLALLAGPRYSLNRVLRQRFRRRPTKGRGR